MPDPLLQTASQYVDVRNKIHSNDRVRYAFCNLVDDLLKKKYGNSGFNIIIEPYIEVILDHLNIPYSNSYSTDGMFVGNLRSNIKIKRGKRFIPAFLILFSVLSQKLIDPYFRDEIENFYIKHLLQSTITPPHIPKLTAMIDKHQGNSIQILMKREIHQLDIERIKPSELTGGIENALFDLSGLNFSLQEIQENANAILENTVIFRGFKKLIEDEVKTSNNFMRYKYDKFYDEISPVFEIFDLKFKEANSSRDKSHAGSVIFRNFGVQKFNGIEICFGKRYIAPLIVWLKTYHSGRADQFFNNIRK